MDARDAIRLLESAVPRGAARWADLGAGSGTFTAALGSILGPGSCIYAVDNDAGAVTQLSRLRLASGVEIVPIHADLEQLAELRALDEAPLDGMLFANSLHFVADAERVLKDAVSRLKVGGRVVVVEYDQREASRWVPYPISPQRLGQLAKGARLSVPTVTTTQPSRYAGTLYVAVAERLAGE